MPTETARITHALNVLIPDMRHGCCIQTARGELYLYGRDAEQLANFMQTQFQGKAKLAVQLDGCVDCED